MSKTSQVLNYDCHTAQRRLVEASVEVSRLTAPQFIELALRSGAAPAQ